MWANFLSDTSEDIWHRSYPHLAFGGMTTFDVARRDTGRRLENLKRQRSPQSIRFFLKYESLST